MWGARTEETIKLLLKEFPDKGIHYERDNENS